MTDQTTTPKDPLSDLREALGDAIPPVFTGEDILPLAIGTADNLVAFMLDRGINLAVAEKVARKTIGAWCNRSDYLAAVALDGAYRYNLNAERVEQVSEVHAMAAAVMLLRGTVKAIPRRENIQIQHPPNEKKAKQTAKEEVKDVAPPTAQKVAPVIVVKKSRKVAA